jgi:crotonobetainyl-CoA:carnitine CoA-transferase CaiB-like acyl-CoA transferase
LATWAGTRGYDPGRIPRSSHPTLVPFGNFPTKDGWIIAGGSKEKFWTRLATAVGRTDLLDDQRFTDFPSRLVHKDELITELDRVFATEVTAVWLDRLEAAQVPCAPVNSIGEALVDKQVLDRELVETVEHPVFGAVKQVRSPVRVGATSRPLLNAPVPGQDTRRVLSELLGYSASHIAELGRAGVIGGPGL